MTMTLGKMPRRRSGPPVAVSSWAAETRAPTATFTASSADRPSLKAVRRYDLARLAPDPVDPKSFSS